MKTKSSRYVVAAALLAASFALSAVAQDTATPAANPFRGKVALIAGFGPGSEKEPTVRKFAEFYADSHAQHFKFASKSRPGPDRFRVLNVTGDVLYEGGDDKQAEAAVVNALTDLPPPGFLVAGVQWRHFKKFRKKFELLGTSVEGSALNPFRNALKSKKPGVAEEAQAVLDAIAKRHDSLIADIEAEKADAPAEAYRHMILFSKTWPSEKKRFEKDMAAYAADPEVKAAYKKLVAPKKRK